MVPQGPRDPNDSLWRKVSDLLNPVGAARAANLQPVSPNVDDSRNEPDWIKAPLDKIEQEVEGLATKEWIQEFLQKQPGNLEKQIGNEDIGKNLPNGEQASSSFDQLASAAEASAQALEGIQSATEGIQSALEGLTSAAEAAAQALEKVGSGGRSSGIAEEAASGGYISGPGSGTSDSIPARLSNGEYVVRASAVRNVGVGFMHAINNFSVGGLVGNISDRMNNLLPRFATGGIVASQSGLSGGLHPVTINFEGRKVGGLYAPGNVIRDMHAASVSNQISSTGKKPSHYR